MSDFKSMLPDFKELGEMTGKLFKDIKNSVYEIVDDYKKKHPSDVKKEAEGSSKKEKPATEAKKKE